MRCPTYETVEMSDEDNELPLSNMLVPSIQALERPRHAIRIIHGDIRRLFQLFHRRQGMRLTIRIVAVMKLLKPRIRVVFAACAVFKAAVLRRVTVHCRCVAGDGPRDV